MNVEGTVHSHSGEVDALSNGYSGEHVWQRAMACFLGLVFILFFSTSEGRCGSSHLRNTAWGMSRFDVMAGEDLSPETFDAYHVHYKTELEGREQDLIYGFFENMLVDAVYVITLVRKDEHQLFRKNLEKKYGRPLSSESNEKGGYFYVWETRATRIVMRPGRLKECRIEYISKKYSYLKEREARAARELEEKLQSWTY